MGVGDDGGLVHRKGMPPMVGIAPRALILGTIPSVISDRMKQYYANPMNGFWKIIYGVWDERPDADYCARTAFLTAHRLALWDVIGDCDIKGSDDGSIGNVDPNDFNDFFRKNPTIGHVFLNGKKASTLYRELIDRRLDPDLRVPFSCLPSTSSAHAISFERKVEAWRAVRTCVEREWTSRHRPG